MSTEDDVDRALVAEAVLPTFRMNIRELETVIEKCQSRLAQLRAENAQGDDDSDDGDVSEGEGATRQVTIQDGVYMINGYDIFSAATLGLVDVMDDLEIVHYIHESESGGGKNIVTINHVHTILDGHLSGRALTFRDVSVVAVVVALRILRPELGQSALAFLNYRLEFTYVHAERGKHSFRDERAIDVVFGGHGSGILFW